MVSGTCTFTYSSRRLLTKTIVKRLKRKKNINKDILESTRKRSVDKILEAGIQIFIDLGRWNTTCLYRGKPRSELIQSSESRSLRNYRH